MIKLNRTGLADVVQFHSNQTQHNVLGCYIAAQHHAKFLTFFKFKWWHSEVSSIIASLTLCTLEPLVVLLFSFKAFGANKLNDLISKALPFKTKLHLQQLLPNSSSRSTPMLQQTDWKRKNKSASEGPPCLDKISLNNGWVEIHCGCNGRKHDWSRGHKHFWTRELLHGYSTIQRATTWLHSPWCSALSQPFVMYYY